MKGAVFYLLILFYIGETFGLYEDQIGKFDWKRSLLGGIIYADADLYGTASKLYVATDQNVVAALNYDDGEIIWRRVLEKGENGLVKLLIHYGNELVTVSGSNVAVVRFWDTALGFINNQYSVTLPADINGGEFIWFIRDNELYCASVLPGKRIMVSAFNIKNGTKSKDDVVLHLPLLGNNIKCAQSNGRVACLDNNGELAVINVNGKNNVISHKIANYDNSTDKASLDAVVSCSKSPVFIAAFSRDQVVIRISNDEISSKLLPEGFSNADGYSLCSFVDNDLYFSVTLLDPAHLKLGYIMRSKDGEEKIQFDTHSLTNTRISYPNIVNVACEQFDQASFTCGVLVSTADKSIIQFKKQLHIRAIEGKMTWKREEALAEIVAVEMMELPISETEAFIQHEFDIKDSGVLNMCIRRIYSQLLQLQNLLLSVWSGSEKQTRTEQFLVRDRFNLHKLIIAVTRVGKIFVIDNISKEILWCYYSEKATAFLQYDEPKALIFAQRSARHFPLTPVCSVVLQNKENGNGIVVQFNPLISSSDEWNYLPYRVLQAMLLPVQNDQYLSGIVIVDASYRAHVIPESETSVVSRMRHTLYFFIAFRDIGRIVGFGFEPTNEKNTSLSILWTMETHGTILQVAAKNPLEKVHSQGRVLADRSVLYKYVNPNLLALVTQQFNNEGKPMLNLFLIDGITGFVIHSDVHQRATGPVHLVHSENWVVLFYFNEKVRRNEVASYELFEGITQINATAFSSVESEVFKPVVDRNAFIVPVSHIDAVKDTITEKGITSKHILLGLGTGSLVEVPWMFLDPRRPSTVTAEMREEGIIPYAPEIPVVTESHINYNQTLYRIKGIYTAPTSLESTCLVFAYGLDLYYTRVAPSKTFDLLKDDFDYYLIVIVLTCLIAATFITKHLAYQKALYQAWR